jgi:hypothetical protein
MIEFTAFKTIFDNKTHRVKSFDSWEDFGDALLQMSKIDGYKPEKGERIPAHASPLISPAIYKPGSTRANENVIKWSRWAALDIDDIDDTLENTLRIFQNYDFYCYSSASSKKTKPKFRVVLQLTSEVEANKIKHFWYALNAEFNSLIDPQTKDMSRMYYVPANYPKAYNFIFKNSGAKVNPSTFMLRHDYVEEKRDLINKLPESIQRALIQKKMDSLTNYDVTWTSYRDCTFVNKKMLAKYEAIAGQDGTGRYSHIYNMMLNIAGNAITKRYPITPREIAALARDIDRDNGKRYTKRPLELEAERALTFAMKTAQNPDFL